MKRKGRLCSTGHGTGAIMPKITSRARRVGGLGICEGVKPRKVPQMHAMGGYQTRQPLNPSSWKRDSLGRSAAKHNRPETYAGLSNRDQILSASTLKRAEAAYQTAVAAGNVSSGTRRKWERAIGVRRDREAQAA